MIEPRREMVFGWGGANHARSWVYRPRTPEQVREAVRDARRRGLTVAHRGGGQSYGDAALNEGGALVETVALEGVLDYDPARGRIRAQAGMTIDGLWRHVISDGWWPPVVPGTSRSTLGGCLAMNVHGKNHVQVGSFADHVRRVTILSVDGQVEEYLHGDPCFQEVVGAQGLNGTILSLEIELVRAVSGYLAVEAQTASNLGRALAALRTLVQTYDYAVAWVDCFAKGRALGRAQLHAASYLPEDHELAGQGLSVEAQMPGPLMLGVLPRRYVPTLLKAMVNDQGIRALNAAKHAHARIVHPSSQLQTHSSFHFLLDYLPDWKRAYGPEGLIQYQFFVPDREAEVVFREALRLQKARGVTSYLGVMKCHRVDSYPNNYSVDGCSLALDFPVRQKDLHQLMGLVRDFEALQSDAGGHVYAAKDAVSRLGKIPDNREAEFSSNLVRRWERASL